MDDDRTGPRPDDRTGSRPAPQHPAPQGPPPWDPSPGQPGAGHPGAGQPGPWGPPPPWLSPQAAEGRSRAETALVLGILSVVTLPLLGPFAVWQANEAEKLGVPATAGRALGWVGTVLLGVMLVFFGIWITAMTFFITSGTR